MALQLADHSIRCLRGIFKNVLLKCDKYILPVDFVVLDMDKDVDVPLILVIQFPVDLTTRPVWYTLLLERLLHLRIHTRGVLGVH